MNYNSFQSPQLGYPQESSYVNTSTINLNREEVTDSRLNKSFIDNKPMIQGLVRSVLKVEKNGEAHLINSGLTDVDGAKQIAANLFGYYDKDKSGSIDTVKVNYFLRKALPMLNNAYRVFNSETKLQKEDVNTFFETLDVDRNKKVTIEDLENLCVRYLTGTTLGVPYKFSEQRSPQRF